VVLGLVILAAVLLDKIRHRRWTYSISDLKVQPEGIRVTQRQWAAAL
jgi:hypothetical protein